MTNKTTIILLILLVTLFGGCVNENVSEVESLKMESFETELLDKTAQYYFPHEGIEHEGTWLQWPHNKTYKNVTTYYDPIWIEMTRGLIKGENVHLIVYNEIEKKRVINLLEKENIDLTKIDFYIFPTDDVWIRDNGPIFVFDDNKKLVLENWEFNGWGNKAPFENDNVIPSLISIATGISKIDISMVMEGGAIEVDGNGTLMSTLSCVNNDNRTANFTLEEIEHYLSTYYGVENFIWLEGVAGMDITDNHIDGMMKFYDDQIIVADDIFDLDVTTLEDGDEKILLTAKNIDGRPYDFIFLPSTKNNVVKVDGEWIKGAYTNFYVANKVVLVPNYNDENDQVANEILQKLYYDKEIIGIDVRDLYVDGGMIHCVTQQQPISIMPEN